MTESARPRSKAGDAQSTAGNANLTITNNSAVRISDWTVRITRNGYAIDLWNAANSSTANHHQASRLSWNGVVEAGATSTPTGGNVTGTGLTNGQQFDCTVER